MMERETAASNISVRHYAGIFLLSLATLLLELSLTRVLSVALWYHFGFLIISTALLGFGASGVVLALWRRLRAEIPLDKALTVLAMMFGVTTVFCFWLMQRIPFDPFSLLADRWQLLFMPLYYLVISTPFFCSGLALALLLTRGSRQINKLYAFDLIGAGVGCAAIALVMPLFGGSGSVVVAAALGLSAAVVFGFRQTRVVAFVAATLCAVVFTSAFFSERLLPISVTPNKAQHNQRPIYTAWNTFSRIDVYERPPNAETQTAGFRRFVFDAGTAATGISDLRPDVRDYLRRRTDDAGYTSGIAYVGKERPKILIIGSGGGQQVLDALHFGARDITAVEINPIINEVVSQKMRDYWGNLFNQPEVRLITEEGRSYVRRSEEQYDAIISVHTISNSAIASGALSLAENYVLTREAFEDYLDHLAPGGVLYLTRPEAQIPRLFATAREVFAARGISDPTWHLYAYRQPPTQFEGQDRLSFSAGFLLKKSQFTPEELRRIEGLLKARRAVTNASPPETLYSPLEPRPDSIYHALVTAPDLQSVYASYPSQLEPATDDRPFFNQHTRWSSLNLATVSDLFSQQRQGRLALEDRPVAEVTLLVLLAQSIVIAAALILLPLARFSRAGGRAPNRWRFLLYFAGLGLGFIMIEIALMQRYMLFLGQPTYTFAVVLASLLVFTGVGAAVSEKFGSSARQRLRLVGSLILLMLMLTGFLTPLIFSAALGWPLLWRVLLSIITLAPLGVLLGMPFPTGLRLVSEEAAPLIPWAWGVNGFFTVIGTVGALILGMAVGFSVVLMIAALCYLSALTAILTRHQVTMPAADQKSPIENYAPAELSSSVAQTSSGRT
jgi:SAM-dependent methyltransferase